MFKYFLSIFIPILIFSCGTEDLKEDTGTISNPEYGSLQNSETPPFSFELVEEIEVEMPEDFILSSFTYITRDTLGNFYFMDYRQSKLISVGSDGKLRWMTGQEGRGPGDFENAYSMILTNHGLMIGNQWGRRIDLFDLDGNYMRSLKPDKNLSGGFLLGQTSLGNIIHTPPSVGDISQINVLDTINDSIKIVNNFEIDLSRGMELAEGKPIDSNVNLVDDKLIAGSNLGYRFEVYNLDGELEKTINRDFDRLVLSGFFSNNSNRSYFPFGRISAQFRTNSGFYVASASYPTNVSNPDDYANPNKSNNLPEPVYENTLDFFDENWKLLYSIESEGRSLSIGYIQKIDDSEFLFTTQTNPAPIIRKYSLKTPN